MHKIQLRRAAAALALLAFGTASMAQPTSGDSAATRRIDALLAPRIATREANGTVLVFHSGRPVYRRDIGRADFARGVPIDDRTLFRLGSISKTFTAGAAMALRAEQRLRFPAPVRDYLPDYPRGDEIRVYHLLTHAAGLGDVPDPPAGRRYRSVDEAIDSFRSAPLRFEPGSRSQYSNAGYVLAARLIEIAGQQSYDLTLRSRFFATLGMASAIEDIGEGAPARLTRFYFPGPGRDRVIGVERADLSGVVGAGALAMSADDLMNWLEAVRTARFFDIWRAEYPFGWGQRTYFGLNAAEQTGRNAGYTTSALIIPERELSVLCLFNTHSGFGLRCSALVAAAMLDQPPPLPALRLDLAQGSLDARVRALAGVYVGANGWRLELAVAEGVMRYRWADRWMPVTPAADGRLLLVPDSAILTPRSDAEGNVEALAYGDGGEEVIFVRQHAEAR